MMMMFITILARDQRSKGRGKDGRLYEGVEMHDSGGTHGHSLHWQVEVGGTSMEEVRGASFAGSSPPFLGRVRAAVDVDLGPERRSPRYHETCLAHESVEESSAADQ